MREEENIALVKRGIEAGMKGDYDTLRSLLTEDVTYVGPFQPELHGIDEVIDSFKQWDQVVGLGWEQEYEGAWADENRVVILHHMRATRDGKTLDTHEIQVVELRDGKACRLTEFASEPEKLAEFMS